MTTTIDMQDLRYLNLFGKITRVSTRFCFKYNETIMFCVPKQLLPKALGEAGKNVRKISEIIRKRVRIIPQPRGVQDARSFIEAIIKPVSFKDIEIKDKEIIVTAGSQHKAALIGRNKRRLLEMQKIVKDYFKKEFRLV
jgi:NusA-like KH domain protein